MTLLILFFAALGTAVISGLVGMAGGVTLFAIMTLVLPMSVIVPLHGAVQLASNLSRSYILRKHTRRDAFLAFLLGAPLGSIAIWFVLKQVSNTDWALIIIIAFLFYVSLKPAKLPEIRLQSKGFVILGASSCFLGALVGATGPFLGAFFARSDWSKEEIVATKASCQIVTHIVKIPIFLGLSFPYQDYALEIFLMIIGVVIGTKLGTILLGKISQSLFMVFLKVILLLSGIRLSYLLLSKYNFISF